MELRQLRYFVTVVEEAVDSHLLEVSRVSLP